MKKLGYVRPFLLTIFALTAVILLYPAKVSAANQRKLVIDSNVSGEEFFQLVNRVSKNEDIYIETQTYVYRCSELDDLAERVKSASAINFDYEINGYEVKTTFTGTLAKLLYKTGDIQEMETGTSVVNIDIASGSDFFDTLYGCRNNCKIRLKFSNTNGADAVKRLKHFQKEVKKQSRYHLNYGICTEENFQKIKEINGDGYIDLWDRTKDLIACEKMVSKIRGWNKMSENKRFLALSDACNKKSRYCLATRSEFHFYNKQNDLVCRDYAKMYMRIAGVISENARSEYIVNKGATHAVAVVNIGSNYWEGNNQYLSKHFKCQKYSLRAIYREDKKRVGTPLVMDFLDANGIN